jgi:hypothetical protein
MSLLISGTDQHILHEYEPADFSDRPRYVYKFADTEE